MIFSQRRAIESRWQSEVTRLKEHLTTWWLKAGYGALTLLFVALTVIYGWVAVASRTPI